MRERMRLAEWQTRWISTFTVAAAGAGEKAIEQVSRTVRLLDDDGDLWAGEPQDERSQQDEPEAVRIAGGPVPQQQDGAQRRMVSEPQVRAYPTEPARPVAQQAAETQVDWESPVLDDPVAVSPGVGTGRVTDPDEIARIEATMNEGSTTERLMTMFPGMVMGPRGPVPGDAVLVAHPPEDDDPRMQGDHG